MKERLKLYGITGIFLAIALLGADRALSLPDCDKRIEFNEHDHIAICEKESVFTVYSDYDEHNLEGKYSYISHGFVFYTTQLYPFINLWRYNPKTQENLHYWTSISYWKQEK